MDFSPKGELAGASESIEVRERHVSKESHSHILTRSCVPGGNRTHI